MPKKIILLIALAVLLAACLPSQQNQVQLQVNTAVAGTMQVKEQIARSVELTVAAKEANGSNIEAPVGLDNNIVLQTTATLPPTLTPFVVPSVTPTATLIPPRYSCSAVTKKPKTNEVFNDGADFDIKWTITNTGTAAWYDAVDIKYYSGSSIANSKRAEIRIPLLPGQSYDVILDATAPKTPGYHFMGWMVDGGMCFAYVNIYVK